MLSWAEGLGKNYSGVKSLGVYRDTRLDGLQVLPIPAKNRHRRIRIHIDTLRLQFDTGTTLHRRRAAVLPAIGAHWDPAVVLANEQAACEMLYSGLDSPTQQIYDYPVAARVIPRRQSGNDVAD